VPRLWVLRATMEKITRFGVSLEPQLLEKFDAIITKKGYTNRSEAIRDLIRTQITQKELKDKNAQGLGTLTILYSHHAGPLLKQLMDLQHEYHEAILTTTHVHIDHDNCLEVLILQGKIGTIQTLADTIKALRGIRLGSLTLTTRS
jgi:CopG family transcriptional regulator, nickel-responsive regulator